MIRALSLCNISKHIAREPEGLLRRRPLCRVPPHHVRHELDGLLRRVGNQSGEGRGRELGELEVHGGGELESLAPLSLVGRPEDRADLEYFVDFGVAWEERPERVQLRHDAAHGPAVVVFCELLFPKLISLALHFLHQN